MLTSVNLMALFMIVTGLILFIESTKLTRQMSNPKLTNMALIKDLLRKRADILKGKPVYVFSKSDRRIWLEEVEKCLRETQ